VCEPRNRGGLRIARRGEAEPGRQVLDLATETATARDASVQRERLQIVTAEFLEQPDALLDLGAPCD
jgi:hypothetical protein